MLTQKELDELEMVEAGEATVEGLLEKHRIEENDPKLTREEFLEQMRQEHEQAVEQWESEQKQQDFGAGMEVITLPHYSGLPFPEVTNEDDAGLDLRSAEAHDVVLEPGDDHVFPTGLKFHIGSHEFHTEFIQSTPQILGASGLGVFGMIVPRSGLGFKHYVRLANTAGIIDASYQGECLVKIRNEGRDEIVIKRGDRMCQIIFVPYVKGIRFNKVDEFTNDSSRGEGGFGSTGVK